MDNEPEFKPVNNEPKSEPVYEQPKPDPQPAPVRKDYGTYGHLFGLIGKPLAHSTSKARFNQFFKNQHINAFYENFEIEDIEQVKDLINNNPNLCGFNVTIPYKQDIIPYLNRLDETAQAIGAVNTVKVLHRDGGVELVGYNTDWIGFNKSFGALLEGHHKALILGTGGVSKAVKYALDTLGIENKFVSRNSTFDIMGYYELSPSVIDDFDVIVNCTPMGMWPETGQCPDIPYTFLSEKHLLLDVIANPDETLFMKKGREHGATAKGGKDMLEQQAVAAWEIWNRIGE
ncbi:MAG: shikimate dehydrogenase [Bacteroidaceae bacterium]|nr:shikimate dehydrogenase [Bacteroidaceae bacterium]